MIQNQIGGFDFVRRADLGSDLLRGLRRGRERADNLRLHREDGGGGLLAGLDARLMVGVDVDQRRVEADRPLEQRDQRADGPGVDACGW